MYVHMYLHMYFSCSVLQKEGEGEEKRGEGEEEHLHHPEIISKFTEQVCSAIGCGRCVMSGGHRDASGFR